MLLFCPTQAQALALEQAQAQAFEHLMALGDTTPCDILPDFDMAPLTASDPSCEHSLWARLSSPAPHYSTTRPSIFRNTSTSSDQTALLLSQTDADDATALVEMTSQLHIVYPDSHAPWHPMPPTMGAPSSWAQANKAH